IELCESVLEAYGKGRPPAVPRPVKELVDGSAQRSRRKLLDARTEVAGDKRRFTRGPRYRSLPSGLVAPARQAFADFVASLPPAPPERFEIVDLAFRIAGTGSLGCLRVAVLTKGKGGRHAFWIFDMKEEGAPAGQTFSRSVPRQGADRALSAMEACLAHP